MQAMQQIRLNDRLYWEARERASAAGFESVDEYIADVVQQDLDEVGEDLNHLFTPERLARIDEGVAQIDAGLGIPIEEVREHFRQRYENER
jgi:predicted transcriptional regulator